MYENDVHIKRVNEKLLLILKNYQALQKENSALSLTVQDLQMKEQDKNQQIELLKQKVQILKASSGKLDGQDQKEFEKRINQYIKDIDQCIGILSE